jgi:hypothetical protein
MASIKTWVSAHHSAILATLVAAQNLPFLKGSAKFAVTALANIFASLT